MNKVLTDSGTPDQTEIADILYGIAEECGVINHDISEALAAISKLMVLERIDENKRWMAGDCGSIGYVRYRTFEDRIKSLKKGI